MEVRDEIKKKGIGGSFTPYSRYKAPKGILILRY